MNIDVNTLLVSIIPSIITAFISYFGATKKANSEIVAVKEITKRELESIKADTDREIEKIKAQTESQIKIMEAQSKSKENEKMNEMMFGFLGPLISNPDNFEKLLKLGKNPTDKDVIKTLKEIKKIK